MNQRPEAEQQAAWKVSRWLAEPEQQAEFFAASGYLPVRLSAYDLEPSRQVLEKYPMFQVLVDLFVGSALDAGDAGAAHRALLSGAANSRRVSGGDGRGR